LKQGGKVTLFHRLLFVISLAVALLVAAQALGENAAKPVVINDNGGWSWFESERAVIDRAAGTLLVSSVANSHGARGGARGGDVDVVAYDLTHGTKQRFTLARRLQDDDHDSAALLILPDGRYLASYSKHASDDCLRYRVSTKRGDITDWKPEQIFYTAAGTTYSNLFYMSTTHTIFDFHRDRGRGFDPNYLVWELKQAPHFLYGGRLLTGPEGNAGASDRPYVRYVGNGVNRIHFLTSDHHPRNLVSNSIYHGYIQAEVGGYGVYRSDDTRLGDLSRDATSPYKASDFTPLLTGDVVSPMNELRMTRGWPTDIKLDRSGNPYAVFTARVEDRDSDHRFFYGRLTTGGWDTHELARAGGYLYRNENDYTGLAALDPNDPSRVFISTNIDPSSARTLAHYEIFCGTTTDGGASWTWAPITFNSTADNLRPIAPRGVEHTTALVWMRGKYNAYTEYDTSIVGLIRLAPANRIAFKSVR
jgi:hypothetical protein